MRARRPLRAIGSARASRPPPERRLERPARAHYCAGMPDVREAEPSAALRAAADALAPGAGAASWRALPGGRTNRVWRVDRPGAALIAKLCCGPGTPLFPNDPAAERAALSRLGPLGLAPGLLGATQTAEGPLLLSAHAGPGRPAPPEAVARALRRLHALPPPRDLRRLPPPGAMLRTLMRALGAPPAGLAAMAAAVQPIRPVWLHGDPVPGNALAGPDGCVLVDWQCPALGDPCWDLALALSPGMRSLDGLAPLDAAARTAAIRAYGSARVAARLDALAPLHAAVIAAHCLWRAERGDAAAREAARAEIRARRPPARRPR